MTNDPRRLAKRAALEQILDVIAAEADALAPIDSVDDPPDTPLVGGPCAVKGFAITIEWLDLNDPDLDALPTETWSTSYWHGVSRANARGLFSFGAQC